MNRNAETNRPSVKMERRGFLKAATATAATAFGLHLFSMEAVLPDGATRDYDEELKNLERNPVPTTRKADFHEFWEKMLKKSANAPVRITKTPSDLPHDKKDAKVYDVSYTTTDDTVINAYFLVPADAKEKRPCVVYFHGGGGKKTLQWRYPEAGLCCLAVDVRGQGGTSPDLAPYSSGGGRGWNAAWTRGILDKNEFYPGNIYLDAVRAVEAASMLDEVDGDLLFTTGASQGGGLSLVTAALSPRVKGAVSMCPSYTCIRNRMEDRTGVLTQITKHVEQHPGDAELIYDNVSYFDALNFAADIKVETLIGIMMNDPICLPRYVYSAYMQLRCKKELLVSPAGHKVTPEAARQGLRFLERLIRSGKRT